MRKPGYIALAVLMAATIALTGCSNVTEAKGSPTTEKKKVAEKNTTEEGKSYSRKMLQKQLLKQSDWRRRQKKLENLGTGTWGRRRYSGRKHRGRK